MTDTEIGYIDYSEMNVDKNASYDLSLIHI